MSNGVEKKPADGYQDDGVGSTPVKRGLMNTSLKYVLSACVASFLFGYQISVLNTIKDYITIEFEWCKGSANLLNCQKNTLQSSFLTAAVFVGAVIGCGFSGYLVKFGRRFSLLIIYAMFILISVLTAITHHFDTIFFARLLSGFAVGLATVSAPMYISEMTHKDKKGTYGVLHQLFITIGICVAVLLGLPLGKSLKGDDPNLIITSFQKLWWRLMLGFPSIVALLGMLNLSFFFKEESPYFLYEQGKVEEAEKTLKKIYDTDDVEEAFSAIKEAIEQKENAKKGALSLFKAFGIPCYRKVIILGCLLSSFQQLTGINVLMANSNVLYQSILSSNTITILSSIMTAVNCVMTIPAIYVVERLGRRTLLLFGSFAIIVAYVPTAIANLVKPKSEPVNILSIAATFAMIVSFAVSYGPLLWVYLHEMFPAEIKDSAASLASLVNWLSAIIVVFPSDIIINHSVPLLFVIFAAMSVLAFLFILFFIKETKGGEVGRSPYITLEERRFYLQSMSSKNLSQFVPQAA